MEKEDEEKDVDKEEEKKKKEEGKEEGEERSIKKKKQFPNETHTHICFLKFHSVNMIQSPP